LLHLTNLFQETKDGVTTLEYLQTIYNRDWANFRERMRAKQGARAFFEGLGDYHVADTTSRELVMELRLWASFRAQVRDEGSNL